MSMVLLFLDTTDTVIEEILDDPDSLQDFLEEEEDFFESLSTSWDGINFLLNGGRGSRPEDAEDPLCFLVAGGQEVANVRAFKAQEVSRWDDVLLKITDEDFRLKYDSDELTAAGVYPQMWHEEGSLEFLSANFNKLKTIVSSARANSLGLLVILS